MMNLKYKSWTGFSLIILLLLISGCWQSQSREFAMPIGEALQKLTANGYLISPQASADFTKKVGSDITLVDLRPPTEYDKGHLPSATNIPIANLLYEEQFDLLKNSKTVVLYGEDVFQASGPGMLLIQLGLENIKILGAGYNDLMADPNGPAPETARYDYALVFQKAVERHQKEIKAGTRSAIITRPTTSKKTIVPKKKKKKVVEEEEGC